MDYFEIFGLPRRLTVDEGALQRRFYELSRRYHPDFHQGASEEDQARALSTSALVNAAYRALRDPIRRVEYLVRLEEGGNAELKEGADAAAADGIKPKAPPGLLAEMFEIQEALQEAKSGGPDEAGLVALREQRDALLARHRAEGARLAASLPATWDSALPAERPRVLALLKEALATRAFLRTVIDDLNQVLGEGQEPHVSHHRH
jgi:molecular chaperone HscB